MRRFEQVGQVVGTRVMRRMGGVAAGLLALSLATGCGSGLSYTVDEDEVKSLTGPQAEQIAESRASVEAARQAFEASKAERTEATAEVTQAERATAAATKTVSAAETKMERADADLNKALEDAKTKRERAHADAQAAYEKAKSAADAAHDKEAAAARQRFGAVKKDGQGELGVAQRQQTLEQAREAYARALLAERAARQEEADAALWVARAKHELSKFDALTEARGQSGPEVTEQRLDFQEQLKEREQTLIEKQRAVAQREQETIKAKAEADRLSPRPPAPAPAPAPAE